MTSRLARVVMVGRAAGGWVGRGRLHHRHAGQIKLARGAMGREGGMSAADIKVGGVCIACQKLVV